MKSIHYGFDDEELPQKRFCFECQTDLLENELFCPDCGSNQCCPQCQEQYNYNDKFCGNCGGERTDSLELRNEMKKQFAKDMKDLGSNLSAIPWFAVEPGEEITK